MRVDQTGRQVPAFAVNNLGVARAAAAGRDELVDLVADQDDVPAGDQGFSGAVEDADVVIRIFDCGSVEAVCAIAGAASRAIATNALVTVFFMVLLLVLTISSR